MKHQSIIAGILAILAGPVFAGQFLAITNEVTDEVTYHYSLTSENFSTLPSFPSTMVVRLDWKTDTKAPSIILCAPNDSFPSNVGGKKRFASKFRVFPNVAFDIEYRPWRTDPHYSTIETNCKEIIGQMVEDNAEKIVIPTSILLSSGQKTNAIMVPLTAEDKSNIKNLVKVWLGKADPSTLF